MLLAFEFDDYKVISVFVEEADCGFTELPQASEYGCLAILISCEGSGFSIFLPLHAPTKSAMGLQGRLRGRGSIDLGN
jgi:hypothetical protein